MAEKRKFVAEKGYTLPEIDVTANYLIKNLTFGPIAITITNTSRNGLGTMTIGGRGEVTVPGNRMTDIVLGLARSKKLRVTKL